MNVLFTSDLHLNHKLASVKRGFTSTEDHDVHVLTNLSKFCGKRTILYVLGDVCMRDPKSMLKLRSVGGRKILVRGNHDIFKLDQYLEVFEDVLGLAKYKNMWLSHCPIHPQELYGKVNIHGHIHKNTMSPELPLPYINVNWDFWGRPLSLEEIRSIIESKKL